ncbi:MAG TPA: transglycosylase domain-containing protein, partial [Burkholderiaceae bacterium]|nr:transglycosylase domain-containing protein [Burkholderiaceae bacterium]
MSSSTDSPKNSSGTSRSWVGRFIFKIAIFVAGLGLCGALLGSLALALAWPNLPDLSAMIDYRPRVPLRIYTADKVLIGEFGEERRNVLRFDEIPDVMKSAILSAEDDRFYQHGGIDWTGVARATLANLTHMSKTQGASTITMQVARNFYLSSEKTYTRKFYELLLTFKIEATLTKDQILDLYMNQIYLGHRAYGFAAASRTYFGKQLGDITPAEAAMLAGIPKAPSRFNPIANFDRAKSRQAYVLGRMRNLGYLTEEEYKKAMDQEIVLKSAPGTPAGGYAVHGEYVAELARQLLYGVYQDNIYSRGFNVYTTVHSKDQEVAYQAVRDGILDYTRRAPYPGPEETVDMPDGIESDAAKLDALLDDIQEKYPDSGDVMTAVVLQASPTKITVARSSSQIIEVTDKNALKIVARG